MKRSVHLCLLAICSAMLLPVICGQTPPRKGPKIEVDSSLDRAEHQTTLLELSKKIGALQCDPNGPNHGFDSFKSPVTVGQSLGERVKSIRVIGFAPASYNRKFSNLARDVQRVWNGQFQSRMCYMGWAEASLWYVEARLQFSDGKQGLLITDGGHVVVQDHEGATWYLRLLPTAQ